MSNKTVLIVFQPKKLVSIITQIYSITDTFHFQGIAKKSRENRQASTHQPVVRYVSVTREMVRGCKLSGVKKIRIHDLRHSHASLLIELGFAPLLISERLGHENVETTLNTYSHLYPNKHGEVAEILSNL